MTGRKVIRFIIGLVAFLILFELTSRVLVLLVFVIRRSLFPNISNDIISNISAGTLVVSYILGLWMGIKVWVKIYTGKPSNNASLGKS